MGDIYIGRNEDGELTHSARGTTWSKDGASYISRKKVNGKWVYTYAKPGHTVSTRSNSLSGKKGFREIDYGKEGSRVAQNNLRNTRYFDKNDPSYNNRTVAREFKKRSDRGYSNYESLKRQSVSAQRNIEKDPRYKVEAKTAYLKNKASRAARKNVAKGKKKVSEILSRLRKLAAATRTEVSKKARAARAQAKKTANSATNKVKKKIQNAVSVKETAYITDVSTGKRRPAPTDLFDNAKTTSRKKKMSGSGTFITSDNKRIKVNPTKKMSGSGTFITSDNKRIKVNPTKKMSGSGTFITSDNKRIKVNPTKKMSGSGTFITSDNKRIKVNPTKKMSGSGTFITSDNKRIKVNPTKKMSGSGTFITSDNKRIKVNPTKKMSGSGTFITSDNKRIKVNPTKKMSGSGTFITSDNKRIKVNPTKKMSGSGTFITSDNKRIKVNRKKKRKS